jgi:hypothetical protein
MNRLRSISVCFFALLVLCPSFAYAGQPPQPLSELVTTSSDATVEKIVEKLFSNNWIILSANQQLGLITFRYQSEENSSPARRHVNVLDGSILVRSETSNSTRVRVKLTLSWQESYSNATFQTGIRNDVPAEWYKLVFDTLGLSAPPTGK